jgi:predicted ATPase
MLFEDVHWSDPTTRESLDLFINRLPALRVLLIVTFRPEFAPPWISRPHVTILTLSRLPTRQRFEMISHVAAGKTLPKEIADQIVDRTDGVPLFIEKRINLSENRDLPHSRNGFFYSHDLTR